MFTPSNFFVTGSAADYLATNPIIQQCCACGRANYRINFAATWDQGATINGKTPFGWFQWVSCQISFEGEHQLKTLYKIGSSEVRSVKIFNITIPNIEEVSETFSDSFDSTKLTKSCESD